jgi:hypothetical protein
MEKTYLVTIIVVFSLAFVPICRVLCCCLGLCLPASVESVNHVLVARLNMAHASAKPLCVYDLPTVCSLNLIRASIECFAFRLVFLAGDIGGVIQTPSFTQYEGLWFGRLAFDLSFFSIIIIIILNGGK